jgi:hypothetical protein
MPISFDKTAPEHLYFDSSYSWTFDNTGRIQVDRITITSGLGINQFGSLHVRFNLLLIAETVDGKGTGYRLNIKSSLARISDNVTMRAGAATAVVGLFCSEDLLDIYPDTTISILFTNPMFNDTGTHSFPFTIPATKQNLKILNFPHRIERYTEIKNIEYPLQIYVEGLKILDGNMVVTAADPHSIECYFKSGNGNFWSAIQGKSLKDIELGESPLFQQQFDVYDYMKDSVVKSFPEMPFAMFPVINTQLAAGTQAQPDWALVNVINYWDVDIPADPTFSQYTSNTPFLYLAYILERLFANFGHTSSYNIFAAHPELKTLVLYSSISNYTGATSEPPLQFVFKDYMIDYLVTDFIRNLEKMFCGTLFVNDRQRTVKFLLFREIISQKELISINKVTSEIAISQGESFEEYNFKFLPDDLAYPTENIKPLSIGTIKAPVDTYATLPTSNNVPNDIRLVLDEDYFYHFTYDTVNGPHWERYTPNIQLETEEPSEEKKILLIESEIFTLPMFMGPDNFFTVNPSKYTHTYWPWANNKGFIPFKDLSDPATIRMTPRLLFYRGLQKDNSYPQNQYPLGSMDVYNALKKYANPPLPPKIDGANISLQWDGEYGLIENFYKEYLAWKMAGPDKLEFNAIFNVKEIAELDFSKKYAINSTAMLLDSVEISLTPQGLAASKVTAYKL